MAIMLATYFILAPWLAFSLTVTQPDAKLDPETHLFLVFGGFLWLVLFAFWHDRVWWQLDGVWATIVFMPSAVSVGLWCATHPWYAYNTSYQFKKRDYDAAVRLEPQEVRDQVGRIILQDLADRAPSLLDADAIGEWAKSLQTGGVNLTRISLDIIRDLYEQDRSILPFPEHLGFNIIHAKAYYASLEQSMDEALANVGHDKARAELIGNRINEGCAYLGQALKGRVGGPFELTLAEIIPSFQDALATMTNWISSHEAQALQIGKTFRAQFATNQYIASKEVLLKGDLEAGVRIHPSRYAEATKAIPTHVACAYLDRTPFLPLFLAPLPWGFSEVLRASHGVIVAGTDGGKSQTLENLILADLDRDDPPGMVVIDSKAGPKDLLLRIARLDVFHPDHGRLRDRLIIIDPRERPALNLFDVGVETLDDQAVNDVVSSLEYFFSSLLGSDITGKQSVIFIPLVELMCHIPRATLNTFIKVLDDITPYLKYVRELPEETRDFLLSTEFTGAHYKETKNELRRRLRQITLRRTLNRMFSAPQNALNIAQALNEGKIILVSAERGFLSPALSPMFARYFISRVISAALDRGRMAKAAVRPARIYIDECGPYVDEKLEEMLSTLRSYGLGAILAFQDVSQMKTYVHTIQSNTAIKLMSTVSASDARAFAGDMRTTPEFIMEHEKPSGERPPFGRFACYARGLGRAISLQIPFGALDKRLLMNDRDYDRMRMFNRYKLMADPTPSKPPDDFEGTTIDGKAEEHSGRPGLPGPKRSKRPTKKPIADPPDWSDTL